LNQLQATRTTAALLLDEVHMYARHGPPPELDGWAEMPKHIYDSDYLIELEEVLRKLKNNNYYTPKDLEPALIGKDIS
jgi:hypothetical protein